MNKTAHYIFTGIFGTFATNCLVHTLVAGFVLPVLAGPPGVAMAVAGSLYGAVYAISKAVPCQDDWVRVKQRENESERRRIEDEQIAKVNELKNREAFEVKQAANKIRARTHVCMLVVILVVAALIYYNAIMRVNEYNLSSISNEDTFSHPSKLCPQLSSFIEECKSNPGMWSPEICLNQQHDFIQFC